MRRSSNPTREVTFRRYINVTGTGSVTTNVFQVVGAVRVTEQAAVITSITTLTNLTNLYADLYDGTVAEDLTLDGATLSGAQVGTVFTKDKVVTQAYSVYQADQCRCSEVLDAKKIGKPFTVIPKNGADTFIRMNYTTTDAPVDFTMFLKFSYEPLDSGYLVCLV